MAIAVAAVLLALLVKATDAVMLIVAGLILGTLLSGLAQFVQKHTPLSCGWSLLIVMILLLGMIVGFGFLVAPQVASQFDALTESLPQAIEQATSWLRNYEWGRRLLAQGREAMNSASGQGGEILRRAGGYFADTLSALADIFIVLIIAIFFAAETGTYRRGFLRLFTSRVRARTAEVLDQSAETVEGWMRGQLVSMAFLGTATYIGLLLIGVPLALILAVIAGVLTIIPYFGPVLAVVPIVLVALTASPQTALYAFIYFVVIQNLEGNLVTPMAQRRAVDLPPVLLLSAQVILGSLIGFFGVLLAAPLMAVALLLVKMLYVEDILGEPTE